MPHFGPGVVGQDIYDRQVAHEQRTGNNHFGPGVTGDVPSAPPPAAKGVGVREVLQAIKDGADVRQLYDLELAREGGARKTVLKAILAEGNRRGMDSEFLDLVANTPLGDSEE